MSRVFYPSYITDTGLVIQVPIGYKQNIYERFILGGFNDAENASIGNYGLLVKEKLFTPRHVNLLSLGKVYFKTFDRWLEFINSTDLADIKNYQSESGTKTCMKYFLILTGGNNDN